MILSASRRTDIPAYYFDWFISRMRAGYFCVRNPMNPHMVSRVDAQAVEGIVFWTKNPLPMLDRLAELPEIPVCVQYTLTPYGRDAEPNLPDKKETLLPAMLRLSDQFGARRVVWRYDPIIITEKYDIPYHERAFTHLARALAGRVETCVISFLDYYAGTAKRLAPLAPLPIGEAERAALCARFVHIASECGITVRACSEPYDLAPYGVRKSKCVDAALLGLTTGKKDPNQRKTCGCDASVDIGAYNTCPNGCLYCYANSKPGAVARNAALHDPASPFLIGVSDPQDIVRDRR